MKTVVKNIVESTTAGVIVVAENYLNIVNKDDMFENVLKEEVDLGIRKAHALGILKGGLIGIGSTIVTGVAISYIQNRVKNRNDVNDETKEVSYAKD